MKSWPNADKKAFVLRTRWVQAKPKPKPQVNREAVWVVIICAVLMPPASMAFQGFRALRFRAQGGISYELPNRPLQGASRGLCEAFRGPLSDMEDH